MREFIQKYEKWFDVNLSELISPFARFSLFLIYFWFGATKIFTISSANEIVAALLDKTLPFVPFEYFILFLGFSEMMIGLFILFPKYSKIMFGVVLLHAVATMMPVLLLPNMTWESFLNPTLEGQYMIKNLALISLAGMLALRSSRK